MGPLAQASPHPAVLVVLRPPLLLAVLMHRFGASLLDGICAASLNPAQKLARHHRNFLVVRITATLPLKLVSNLLGK